MSVDRSGRVVFTLELVSGTDPPEGRLLADESEHEFVGWLGLALALEQAMALEEGTHPTVVVDPL